MPTLSIRRGTGQTTELPLERPLYSVGRSADNDIVLEGAGVSRHHCAIEFDGKHHYVRDLESHNGVYVNGALVDRAELRPRDEIRIGSTVLVYEPESDPITDSFTIEQDYDEVVTQLRSGGPARAEPEKERRTLALLCDLSFALSSVTSTEDVARRAIQILLETTRAERGAIFLLEGGDGNLKPVVVCERGEPKPGSEPVALSSTVAHRILSERKGLIAADAAADPRFSHGQSVVLRGLRSICCAPLVGKGGDLGVLYLENNRVLAAFTTEDLRLLCAVASQIALTVENARFFDALKRSNEELEKLVEQRTAALRVTELRLYQSEKMSSLSRLVAGVTHEINSPLGALKANLELLNAVGRRLADARSGSAGDVQLDESWQGMLEVLQESLAACGRIMSVVRSLRSYARLDESEFKVADVNEGLKAVIELLDPALRRNVAIELALGSVPPIPCFPALLNEAFMNLLVNACQACQRAEGGGRVKITTRREGIAVVVEISDNGPGIPLEQQAKIFDPGFTTRGVGVGLGLGLSIAYLVVREHGGSIMLDSQPGAGAAFTVRLPVEDPARSTP
jgi:signal transduction histidine kinase